MEELKIACARLMVLLAILGAGSLRAQVSVYTANYGNDRSNANLNEHVLNTSNVTAGQFGKLLSLTVDGQIYAQPLYASAVAMPGGKAVKVVYAATMHNSVYAFDADSGNLIWQVNLGPSVPTENYDWPYGVADIDVEAGILSTPVIDPTAQVIYAAAATYEGGSYLYRLHALDLASGAERMNGPAAILGAVTGTASDAANGSIVFNPLKHLQRPGLLLLNGAVYMAFASHGDDEPYHGWIFAYNSHDLSQQTAVFNVTPNGSEGGIWQSGRGLAADDAGSIYAIAGNGDYDGAANFGQSFLRLAVTGKINVADWFTPDNWSALNNGDQDLGTAGPILIPSKSLILGANKSGSIYVVDSARMGGLQPGNPQAVQIFQALQGIIFNLALWSAPNIETLYVQGNGTALNAYCITNRTYVTTPCSKNSSVATTAKGGIVVSADGGTPGTGILWTTSMSTDFATFGNGTLHAFDASDVSKELWNSDLNAADALGSFAKFATPTVAAGKVYVPTFSGQLVVYGPIPTTVSPAPSVQNQGTVNNASFAPGSTALAAGTIAAIFGTHLNDGSSNSSSTFGRDGKLATMLGGASVIFNGFPSPMFSSFPDQLNVELPLELAGAASASVQVTVGGQTSAPQIVPLGPASPGIFAANSQGTGQGAIQIANTATFAAPAGSIPGADARPANPGETITIYCTGLGAVTNAPATGAAASSNPLSTTIDTPQVAIGGIPAAVSFAGLAPGFVGLYQVNVEVPASSPADDAASVVLSIGGIQSNVVTIAIAGM